LKIIGFDMLGKMKHNMMVFMSKRMLSCDEASFLMSKKYEEKITFKERFRLKMHLLSCYLCRRYEKQLAQLNSVVVDFRNDCQHQGCQHSMPTEAKIKTIQLVNKELNTDSK